MKRDAVAGEPASAAPCSNSTATRGSTSCARGGRDRAAALLRRWPPRPDAPRRLARVASLSRARRSRPAAISSMQIGAGAAVLVADRQDAGGDRRRDATAGCPRPPAAPRRTTARRRRDRPTPIRIASSSRRSPGDGSRPRCSSTIVSVNVAVLHQRRDVVPANPDVRRVGRRRSRCARVP